MKKLVLFLSFFCGLASVNTASCSEVAVASVMNPLLIGGGVVLTVATLFSGMAFEYKIVSTNWYEASVKDWVFLGLGVSICIAGAIAFGYIAFVGATVASVVIADFFGRFLLGFTVAVCFDLLNYIGEKVFGSGKSKSRKRAQRRENRRRRQKEQKQELLLAGSIA